MKDLKPGMKYYYTVGDAHATSRVFSFKTYPEIPRKTRVLTFGDIGSEPIAFPTHERIKERVLNEDFDLVVHVGDIAYADGIQQLWDYYFRKVLWWIIFILG